MNTNEKGNTGLIKVIADLYSKGFHCFTPFDDYSPVDCIVMNSNGKTFRLQIKYRSPDKDDCYKIYASSVVNGKRVKINKDLIDYWAVYLSDIDKIVYLPVSVMENKNSHTITQKQIGELDERLKSAPC